jgi:nucleotide-binding universal stress UspA family protein
MGMNARGSTEVIVATIGLSIGVLSHNLFTMIVAMAVITTTAMPPTLRWALRRLPMRRDEKARLERELYERNAFMPNLERVLLAVDGGANGRFASRLAGLLAAERKMPVTVLDVANNGTKTAEPRSEAGNRAAACGSRAGSEREEAGAAEVDVIVRKHDVAPAEAIATEAQRGYDLLMIGIDTSPQRAEDSTASCRNLSVSLRIGGHCGCARCASGNPTAPLGRILVPVTGNENARRGAEVAITLAHALDAEVATLSVVGKAARNRRQVRREIQAVADEIKKIANYLGRNSGRRFAPTMRPAPQSCARANATNPISSRWA